MGILFSHQVPYEPALTPYQYEQPENMELSCLVSLKAAISLVITHPITITRDTEMPLNSRSSRKRQPQKFQKVIVTRAGRL